MACTHGFWADFPENPVPRFQPIDYLVERLQAFDPDLRCDFRYKFGGRLVISSRLHYAPDVDLADRPETCVHLVLTREDGGPRQIIESDLDRVNWSRLESWEGRWEEALEHNRQLDAFHARQSAQRDEDRTNVFLSTRNWGDTRSPHREGASSEQYICRHGLRNVNCVLCKPVKRSVFHMDRPSGEANNGHESIDMRDVPSLQEQVRRLVAQTQKTSERDLTKYVG